MGASYSGNTLLSKRRYVGSIPTAPALIQTAYLYGMLFELRGIRESNWEVGSGGKVFPRPPFERLVQKEHKQKIPGLFAGDFSFFVLSAFSAHKRVAPLLKDPRSLIFSDTGESFRIPPTPPWAPGAEKDT